MIHEQVAIWAMIGAWANAIAMGVAAVFAFMAWRSDRRGAATSRIDAFIVSLTTGAVASARDRLTSWIEEHKGERPPDTTAIGTTTNPIRQTLVTDDAERDLRHSVFEILWLLQRCSGLEQDLRRSGGASRDVVFHHLSLVANGLNSFASALSAEEIAAFRDSATTAELALKKLKERFPTADVIEFRFSN